MKIVLVCDFAEGAVPSAVQELIDAGAVAYSETVAAPIPRAIARVSERPAADRVHDLLKSLVYTYGIRQSGIAAIVGVGSSSVTNWLKGRNQPEPKTWARLKSLLRRAETDPASVRLEAAGAAKAAARLRSRGVGVGAPRRSLSDAEALEAAVRQDGGEALHSLAGEYGVADKTLRRSIDRVRRLTA